MRLLGLVALHQIPFVRDRSRGFDELFKCFILLLFDAMRQCGCRRLVQCTKNPLTQALPLP